MKYVSEEGEELIKSQQIQQQLLNNELVQALMSTLNITQNINDIIVNERKLFVLNASKGKTIPLDDKAYVKKSINFNIREQILKKYEDYLNFSAQNPNKYTEILNKDTELILFYLTKVCNVENISLALVQRNYETLKPIIDGEMYKLIDNVYSTWRSFDTIIDNLNAIISQSKSVLKQELEKLNNNIIKAKEKELTYEEKVEQNRQELKDMAEEDPEVFEEDESKHESIDEIKEHISEDGTLIFH